MICPLYRGRDNTSIGQCAGRDCVLTDKSGNCLIKQALLHYIESSSPYYPDEVIRPKTVIPPTEVDFGPPRIDGSYIFSKGV